MDEEEVEHNMRTEANEEVDDTGGEGEKDDVRNGPLLTGLAGGVGGWLLSQKVAAPVPDVTYEEPPPNILATGRAGEILKFGAPKEGVSGPLVYKNHVLAYDSARRVSKWVAEHLSRDIAGKEQVVMSYQDDVLISTTMRQTGRVSTLDLIPQYPRSFLAITGIGRGS